MNLYASRDTSELRHFRRDNAGGGSGSSTFVMYMYITEIADILCEAGVTVRFLADDLKMYARIINCVDVIIIQNAFDRLVYWAHLWQLQISITKCNSMHISYLSVLISNSRSLIRR